MRPLLFITFPHGFRISKNFGHPTSGSGGKKTVKRYLKSEQTDRQTDRQTHIWTYRLIESIDPEGRCFENPGLSYRVSYYQCYYPHLPSESVSAECGIFNALALRADSFYKSKCPYFCLFVCLCVQF